jgi:hypothetical protein
LLGVEGGATLDDADAIGGIRVGDTGRGEGSVTSEWRIDVNIALACSMKGEQIVLRMVLNKEN